MTWLTWLILAVVLTTVVAIAGFQPEGARHVGRTRLMGVARVVLVVTAAILAFVALRARSGG
jgi:hypothetical protein